METWALWIVTPLLGAFIGWVTNRVAIKMLFHPREQFLGFQGLIPKRKKEIATKVAKVVSEQLLRSDDIKKKIQEAGKLTEEKAKDYGQAFLEERPGLNALIPKALKNQATAALSGAVKKFTAEFSTEILQELNIAGLVEERVASFENDKLEELIKKISSKELKHIEILGGVLGGLIGLINAVVVYWT